MIDYKHYNAYATWARRQIRREQILDAVVCGLAWLFIIVSVVAILSLSAV